MLLFGASVHVLVTHSHWLCCASIGTANVASGLSGARSVKPPFPPAKRIPHGSTNVSKSSVRPSLPPANRILSCSDSAARHDRYVPPPAKSVGMPLLQTEISNLASARKNSTVKSAACKSSTVAKQSDVQAAIVNNSKRPQAKTAAQGRRPTLETPKRHNGKRQLTSKIKVYFIFNTVKYYWFCVAWIQPNIQHSNTLFAYFNQLNWKTMGIAIPQRWRYWMITNPNQTTNSSPLLLKYQQRTVSAMRTKSVKKIT